MKKFEQVFNIAKRRGFFTISSEIHNPPAGFFDFGPLGTALKHNLENLWRQRLVVEEGNYEIETSIICPEEVFIASGHVAQFNDPLSECTKCHKRFRADHLIKEQVKIPTDGLSLEQLSDLIKKHGVRCPDCKGSMTDASYFNMMFRTSIGATEPKTAYVRPETAQGMFVNFRWVLNSVGGQLPLGIAQIGRSFRNEISPRQGMIRLRELNQAELELFLLPDQLNNCPQFSKVENFKLNLLSKEIQSKSQEAKEMTAKEAVSHGIIANPWIAYHLIKATKLYQELGISPDNLRCRQHLDKERAHYSKDCWDLEVLTDFGWIEVIGIAYRTDYDLSAHIKMTEADLYVVNEKNEKIIPHVVEPSYGLDRMIYCVMEHAFREDDKRAWLAFPPKIAPIKVEIFPIVNDPELNAISDEIKDSLTKAGITSSVSIKGSVGKRYAKADEAGTPWCVTIDRQTQQDKTVTIRDRDSRTQIRLSIKDLVPVTQKLLNQEIEFSKAGKPVS